MSENIPTLKPGATQAAPPPRRARRWLARIALGIALLALLLAGLAFVAVRTEWGARSAWQLAARALKGSLSGELADGTLAHGITLRKLRYRDQQRTVAIDRLSGAWRLSFSPLKLTISSLEAGKIDLTQQPSPTPAEPARLPAEIRLPLAIDLQRLAIGQLLVHQGDATTPFSDIHAGASSDRVHHRLELRNAVTPWGKAQTALQLDGTAPFAVTGAASLDGAWEKIQYKVDTRLSGTLEALGIALDASGGAFSAMARIEATPFAAIPFKSARLSADHLDPRMFSVAAPRADLKVMADIIPVSGPGQASPDLSQMTVAGPVSIANARPGPIDQELLPLISLTAQARMDAQQQTLSDLKAELSGGGTLEGSGERHADGKGRLALQARKLDLHALYAALKPTSLDGPLDMQMAGDSQQVSLRLADPQFNVAANADITPQEIALRSAKLTAGVSRLDLAGTMGRGPDAAYAVEGKLADFNPAQFLAAMQPAPAATKKPAKAGRPPPPRAGRVPQADINMTFSAKGNLKPELQARVQFDIQDSSYDKLPMTGGGRLELIGKRLPSSDAQLTIAGNRLAVQGGFGVPGKQLAFSVHAPALERLGFGLSGLLAADGTLAGTMEQPVVQASVEADKLAFGEYRVARLTGKVDTNGVPGVAPDAKVKLALDGRGVLAGEVRLEQLKAGVDGTYASHTIDLNARGTLGEQPLRLTLAASGALRQTAQGPAWDGRVQTLQNSGLPRLSLEQPLTVSAGPGQVELGATRLTVEKALVDLRGLQFRQDGPIRSQGSISSLDVGHMLTLWKQVSGSNAPLKTDMVLDASWNFTLADSASGFFEVERKRGDVELPTSAGATPLGLKQLRLRGDFNGDALRLDAAADTARLGSATANGRIGLMQEGPRLTILPESGVSGSVAASLPQLKNLGALTGPRIALAGNVKIDLAVSGSVGKPVSSGELAGSQLALTLYDQGVHLHDGVARITVANNVAELREVMFRGGDGTVRATGRIPLDQASSDVTATIVADRLQLLADPSAQLTLSGRANVANTGDQLRVSGKFTVDRALFSLPEESAPKLGDDVVVYRGGAKPAPRQSRARIAEKPSSPFAPNVDVQVALGDSFRFKGSGADLRLAGELTIRTGPGEPLQAQGTVRIAEGTYKAFGAELVIDRGVLNFTGPLTNPNINILAMRRKQEVAAGVQVTGTVQQPRVTLVSDPNVADEEKLSWLVFGHAGNTSGGGAQAAARGAAAGLLNKVGGERIAKGLGLDQFSLGTSEFGTSGQQVVNLGKNITERLAIGYEQSLAGAASVLKLTYQLSRSWSVALRSGQVSGLDVSYSRRFDRFGADRERAKTP
jgi:translocation and assembly module TamB